MAVQNVGLIGGALCVTNGFLRIHWQFFSIRECQDPLDACLCPWCFRELCPGEGVTAELEHRCGERGRLTRSLADIDIKSHVSEEISKLGEGESNLSAEDATTSRLGHQALIFHANCDEWLKLGLVMDDVSFCDFGEARIEILFIGVEALGDGALLVFFADLFNPHFEQIGGHDHLVCLSIV